MRFAVLTLPSLLIAAFLAGPALGAVAANGKPAKRYTPPAPPVAAAAATDAGLRGSLSAGAATTPSILALPSPGTGFATLSTGGLSPAPIIPIRTLGDPAPLCRAACAETRYACDATEDTECSAKWAQCAADCSVPTDR